MGNIVFAGALSHAPHITAFPDRADPQARDRLYAAMEAMGRALRSANPDVMVIVTSDHFTNLFTDRMPAFLVGSAESYEGPVEDWIRLPQTTIPGHLEFSRLLLNTAYASDFEPAFSGRVALEHGIAVPLHFLAPQADVPIVPVLQNCMVPPLPRMARCYEFGRVMRQAAERSGLRVAVVGTGGLSHSPGAPEAGIIDETFDREFLRRLTSDRPVSILDLENERIDAAGFGAWEIRQWATALGSADGGRAQVLAYEPMEPWETGCAVAMFAC